MAVLIRFPQSVVLQEELEKVQNRDVRFVTSNCCFETGSMNGILKTTKIGVSQGKEERQYTNLFCTKV